MSKIIKKYRTFNNWDITLEEFNNDPRDVHVIVRGEYYGESPHLYVGSEDVAYDRPERIPLSVRKYLRKNRVRMLDDLRKIGVYYL